MKTATVSPRRIVAALLFVASTHAIFGQDFYSTYYAHADGFDGAAPISRTQETFAGGIHVAESNDSDYPGVTAYARTLVRAELGHLGIDALDIASAAANVPPSLISARSEGTVGMSDTVWFYTTEVLYAQRLDIHLQARVDGTFFGEGVGALPNFGTYNGIARFTVGIDGLSGAFDSYEVNFGFNGTGMDVTETGDRLIDLRFQAWNTPNMRFMLRQKVEFYGSASAYKANDSAPDLNGELSFLFGNSLTWLGLVSASSGGVPIEGPVVWSSDYVDYNRSYDTLSPVPVPEPSTFSAAAAGVLFLLCLIRRRSRTACRV